MKRVQDPVHGLMEFRGTRTFAVELLRAPEVQRLRRVRQLGLVHLVYPGAEHSRFSHSLGAAHLMGRFLDGLAVATHTEIPAALQVDRSTERDLVTAALCHDLGHGPLSHVWEQHVIRDLTPWRKKWATFLDEDKYPWLKETTSWHEYATQAIVLGDTKVHEILEKVEAGSAARVAALLGGVSSFPHLPLLLASDVDVDRCDYILRDAYQTGVAYGRYDLNWLVSTITIGTNPDSGKPVLGFDKKKAPRVIEQLLIARRALYDNVYHHSVVRAAERMVGLLLARAAGVAETAPDLFEAIEGVSTLKDIVAGKAVSVQKLIDLSDDGLWFFITKAAGVKNDPILADLARRVVERDLFREVAIDPIELDRMIDRDPEGLLAAVDEVLLEQFEGPPSIKIDEETARWYRVVDRADFAFFHPKRGQGTWFVDRDKPERLASELSAHRDFARYSGHRRAFRRLYVPRGAVRSVSERIAHLA